MAITGFGGPIRPPIGLRPKGIVDQLRKCEIVEAMLRYTRVHKQIPSAWIVELEDLNG